MINDELLQKMDQLNKEILSKWINQELFSWQWLLIIFLLVISYVVFFINVDKKRFIEIMLYGSFIAVSFVVYDSIGWFFGFWTTTISVLPFYPNFFGSDFTIGPLFAMLVYQHTSSWRSFIIEYVLFSVLFIFGYYSLLLVNIDAFSYLKPFARIIDFSCFLIIGIISRLVITLLLRVQMDRQV
ncbi:hypothetical protein LC087_04270 [Bacillus carboniphilus]|uniref:Rod shape-determining protein MreD n=1 Tax=Bacillus carboniphilus TaxID=86663 RepID=A0ABY9JVG8_9BACI|nr:hypothetical protein [Bacillus carboniphilus]WLR43401.1 hypothetical protein LC087_04270 [Bacillus carboniphilus]